MDDITTTNDLIDFFDRAAECDEEDCILSPIHLEAASIAEDLRQYRDECDADVLPVGALQYRKAQLYTRMEDWDLAMVLALAFPEDSLPDVPDSYI